MYYSNANGDQEASPAGMLLLAAGTYYRLKHENSPERVESARETMQSILAAARQAGYARISQLTGVLVSGECSHKVIKMAHEACGKVPLESMREILAKAKFC